MKFINNIKSECIQVTDHQDIVITQDAMENANMGYLFVQIKKWIQELDLYREVIRQSLNCLLENYFIYTFENIYSLILHLYITFYKNRNGETQC